MERASYLGLCCSTSLQVLPGAPSSGSYRDAVNVRRAAVRWKPLWFGAVGAPTRAWLPLFLAPRLCRARGDAWRVAVVISGARAPLTAWASGADDRARPVGHAQTLPPPPPTSGFKVAGPGRLQTTRAPLRLCRAQVSNNSAAKMVLSWRVYGKAQLNHNAEDGAPAAAVSSRARPLCGNTGSLVSS